MRTHKYLLIISLAALLSLFFTGCSARMGHEVYSPAGKTWIEASTDGYYYSPGHHHKPKKHKHHKDKHHKDKHHKDKHHKDKHHKKHHKHHDD